MIDQDRRNAIYQLHLAGMPLQEISRQFHVSRNTVRAIIRQQGATPQTTRKDKTHIDPDLLRRLYHECDGWLQRVHEKLIEVAASYPNITFIYLEDISMAEVRQRVGQLTPDSLVLVTIFSRDATGEFFEYDVFTPLISESSAVPVYGTWDFSLGYGIVGGKLTSGVTEGERVAQLATRILSGERPQDIPVVQEPAARYMFDYEQLQHWGIPDSILPEDSVIINRPFSFFEQYAQLVWVVGISFVALSTAIAVLAFNMLRRRRAEVQLTHSLVELQEIRASLEDRVQERTEAFQQRAALLEAAAEVSRATTEMVDIDVLLPQVVELVRQRFNLYYVGLFLVDETGRYAVLRAGTGDPGREMLARGWQLEAGGQSMIGRCVASGQAGIQLDVGEAAIYFDNPYLPETRSEMALPLRARGQVIGAMTIQSNRVAAFAQDDIRTMQTMADQIASVISNARLFAQVQESLAAERRAYGEITREAWLAMLQSQADLGFVSDRRTTVQNVDVWRPEMETALSTGQVASSSGDALTLAIPIIVRDQVVGVVDGRKPDGTVWSEEEAGLLQALTEQLSAALEGAQLYRESQSAAVREQLFSQVSGRIRQELELEAVLKTTVDQIQEALGLDSVAIRLVRDAAGLQVAHAEQAGEYHD